MIAARGAAVALAYRNVLALSVRIKETEVGLHRDEVDGDALSARLGRDGSCAAAQIETWSATNYRGHVATLPDQRS